MEKLKNKIKNNRICILIDKIIKYIKPQKEGIYRCYIDKEEKKYRISPHTIIKCFE